MTLPPDEAESSSVPVVLALGANLGDAVATLTAAVDDLDDVPGVAVVAVSPLSRTEPVGGPEQPAYLNAVVLARTVLAPDDVLAAAHEVEQGAGRVREVRWGPRTLDIDVIQYGAPPDTVLSSDPDLTLPHPRAHERAFVLWPWSQADAGATLVLADGELASVSELVATATDRDGVRPGPPWPQGSRAAARSGRSGSSGRWSRAST